MFSSLSRACSPLQRYPSLRLCFAPLALFAALSIALTAVLTAALPADVHAAPSLRFKTLAIAGNEEPAMQAMLQDRQGFIWIGTHASGLYRYDGYQAIRYMHHPGRADSLPHDQIATLFEDRQGRIWVGTRDGLARFNPADNNFTVFAPKQGPGRHRIVKAIVSDGKDGLWLATWGGLQHFDPATGQFDSYVHDPADPASLASNDLNALAVDGDGGVWAATWPGGLDYLAPGARAFRHHRVDTGAAGAAGAAADPGRNIVRALHFDGRGALWIGTEQGVLRWDGGTPWSARAALASPASRVTQLYSDRSGTLWATTLSAGLLRWDAEAGRFTQYLHLADDPHSLPGNALRAVLHDRGGMLWVMSATDGVSLVNLNSAGFSRVLPFRTGAASTADARSAAVSNTVLSVARAADGKLWLGGDLGLSLYDPVARTITRTYRAEAGRSGRLSNDLVFSLYQQPGGPLWIGTPSGLDRLDGADAPLRTIRFGSTAGNYINAIAPGANGVLWLGTGDSLVRYDPASGAQRSYRHDPRDAGSRAVNGASTVLEDSYGRVWAGSSSNGGGLDMLAPQGSAFRHFRHRPDDAASLSDDQVTSLYEDRQRRLWAGTARGVNEVIVAADGAVRFRRHALEQADNRVLALHSDAAGMLWIATADGLFRLTPDTGALAFFPVSDGLTEGLRLNAAETGADGRLYFGGAHGMTAVEPAAVRSAPSGTQVAFTDITVFNRSLRGVQQAGRHGDDADPVLAGVALDGPVTKPLALTLPWKASVFALEFAALQYTEPMKNRYAYRLEGFDRDWVLADAAHRSATYTNLDPGEYVFKVKASNHRGVWNEQPSTLRITITPPFWERWWFRLLAGALVIAVMRALYRWRIRRLTRRQAELERVVAARTSELEASNSKLAALSTTDGLTGVCNRRGFDTALEAEWWRAARSGQPLALAMLDVDYFKKYNDRYGHLAGDACLRTVAELIAHHARRTTDLAARYGGEEFALLAAATDAADAYATAEIICAELVKLALPHEDSPFGIVTISIGVAVMVPTESSEPGMLVEQADQALYRAKDKGRNQAMLTLPVTA